VLPLDASRSHNCFTKLEDTSANNIQFGGSPVKVGEDEYTLFRDSEYVALPITISFSV
jgi:hypothetical protein